MSSWVCELELTTTSPFDDHLLSPPELRPRRPSISNPSIDINLRMSFQSGPSRGPNPFGLSGSLAGHHPPPPPAGHITQRPLGPPTQPSQSGSSSSRPWPLNIPGGPLQLFFDPHSARASKLKRELEVSSLSRRAREGDTPFCPPARRRGCARAC